MKCGGVFVRSNEKRIISVWQVAWKTNLPEDKEEWNFEHSFVINYGSLPKIPDVRATIS